MPLTYPGGGDTVTLVRGHEDESQTAPQIDWASLAKLKGTIVCYAGTRQLPAILDALLSHGRAKTEPAAVIYEGTLPGQQTVDGTLGELAELTQARRARAVRRFSSSDASPRCASTCAGSTIARCSDVASS